MSKNTIKLKKYVDIIEEYKAAASITPGNLLEYTSAGKVQPHQASGNNAVPFIALEDELQGNGIGDDYLVDDPVQAWVATRGDHAYMILEDGENVTQGDFLESAGNGNLQKYTSNPIVGQALESKDLSGSSGEESSGLVGDQRIKVRIV